MERKSSVMRLERLNEYFVTSSKIKIKSLTLKIIKCRETRKCHLKLQK